MKKSKYWSLFLGLIFLPLVVTSVDAQGPEPEPFNCTGQAFTVRFSPAELYIIDQSVTPFTFNPIAAFSTELNNLGFRSTDGLLYAMELNISGSTPPGNNGIVKIDSTGAVFPVAVTGVSIPTNVRFPAGDVSPDGTTMYIAAQVNSVALPNSINLYSVDLTQPTPVVSAFPRTGTGIINVADWAVSPIDGFLYGASGPTGALYKMSPTGVTTQIAGPGFLPSGGATLDAYGGAWFNAAGRLFLYRNVGEIYEVDLSGPTIASTQVGGPESTFNDAAACAQETPAVDIEKTVYAGHDAGASAPGGQFLEGNNGDNITYVFTITNIGNVTLTDLSFNDGDLGITLGDLAVASGALPLVPGDSIVYYYQASINANLVNTACVVGTPTTPEACDDAAVLAPTVIEVGCTEGCTPGYWKNHIDSWIGYLPDDNFHEIFGVGPDITLLEALNEKGNTEASLNRYAVAALLNASAGGVDYPLTPAEVISRVQCAYDTGCEDWNFHTLKEYFEGLSQYCPL